MTGSHGIDMTERYTLNPSFVPRFLRRELKLFMSTGRFKLTSRLCVVRDLG